MSAYPAVYEQDFYVDASGVRVAFMPYADALSIVIDLASSPVPIPGGHFPNLELTPQMFRQQAALAKVIELAEQLVKLNLSQRTVAGDWATNQTEDDQIINPYLMVNAMKIVVLMAEEIAIDPAKAVGVDINDEVDLQQQALDVIRDLIGDHSKRIAALGSTYTPAP